MRRADIATVRNHNSTLVLKMIRRMQPISMKELADQSGLQPSTVSRLLRALADQELVSSAGLLSPKAAGGRPAEQWTINGRFGACIGLYLASNLVAGVSVDLNRRLLGSVVLPLDSGNCQSAERIVEVLREAARRLTTEDQLGGRPCLGIGLAAMGLIDAGTQSIRYFNLDIQIGDSFFDHLPDPVIGNDANVVALGEATHGVLEDVRNAIVLYAHEGVGAGLILDGRLVRGQLGGAGELGYHDCQLLTNPLLDEPADSRERFISGACNLINLLNPEVCLLTGDLNDISGGIYKELEKRIGRSTNRVARNVRVLRQPCDPMGVARHMATIVLDEKVFGPTAGKLLSSGKSAAAATLAKKTTKRKTTRIRG